MEEIESVGESLRASERRNGTFMDQYEATYERILAGAEEIVRRMKRTFHAKREFCQRVVEDHAEYVVIHAGAGSSQNIC